MDNIQSILGRLQKLLYLDKMDIDDLPVNELKKVVYSKLNMILEHDGNATSNDFETILNIFMQTKNKEGIISLLTFLLTMLRKIDSLQEEVNRTRIWTMQTVGGLQKEIEDMRVQEGRKTLERNPLEFYAIRYGIQKAYKDTYYSVKNHMFRGKGCIYCVITGNYDQLAEPQFINPELDYICFTDNKELASDVWRIIQIDRFFDIEDLDKVRIARYIKIVGYQFLGGYDYSIYVDGKVRIIENLLDYIEKYAKSSSLLCCPHYKCQSLYEEVPEIIRQGLDDTTVVENQIKRYRNEGFPPTYQQIDSTCLVRSHLDKELDEVMKAWWFEVKNGSKRDQLSFTYVCWKKGYTYDISDVFSVENKYFICTNHK